MVERTLSGLKVVEYGEFISAPYCTKMMADMGAEVIKIEEPGSGDRARRHGPFPDDTPHPERSGLFLWLNCNKLGITLNVREPTGRKLFNELLQDTDIIVENNAPQVMKKLGLDYSSIKGINPRLIMTSITPYGQTGPYKDYKGYAINMESAGAVPTGVGNPNREPLALPFSLVEYTIAINGAAASLVALFAREKTGAGQHVDISGSQVIAGVMNNPIANHVFRSTVKQRFGWRLSNMLYPMENLPCKDGHMNIMTMEFDHWLKFIELMGNPEWAQDPRFTENQFSLVPHADELDAHLISWLMERTKDELFDLFRKNHIPFAPVNSIEDLTKSPQLKARDFFIEIEHPEAGRLKYPGSPAKLATGSWRIERPAPLLGQHNEEVFCRRLGYSKGDLVELRREGII